MKLKLIWDGTPIRQHSQDARREERRKAKWMRNEQRRRERASASPENECVTEREYRAAVRDGLVDQDGNAITPSAE